ncbi:MAG TPA: TIGR03620 family F420-dependent LLM class oxidoreductase [Candidatus Binataceae bacterium]|nr:TIGR03620 family F420-dependent LLM class oxidoreductase [Candidatus Binataceae bacterium]
MGGGTDYRNFESALRTPGVFAFLDGMGGEQTGQFARKIERLGYSSLWFPELFGREIFTHASYLLSSTDKLIVAAAVAVAQKRDPLTSLGSANTLAELYGSRFILGLGISHRELQEIRGLTYEKPYTYMRDYLARMKAAPDYQAPKPKQPVPVLLGALLPKMTQLAASETQGTHTYFVTPEQTARTRAAIGPDKWICAAQAVHLETDATKARDAARKYMSFYLRLPTYSKHLAPMGFGADDIANGGSDRLADAIVAWGTEDKVRERIDAHYKAGATHVCVLPVSSDGGISPDELTLEALAPR